MILIIVIKIGISKIYSITYFNKKGR